MHIRNESSLLRRGFLGCHAMLPQRGGSIAWHPKKLLRRRLKWKRSSQIKRTKKGAYVIVSCSRQKSYWMFTKLVAYWWLQRWKTKILKSRDEGREEISSPLRQKTNQFSQALRCCYSHQLHYNNADLDNTNLLPLAPLLHLIRLASFSMVYSGSGTSLSSLARTYILMVVPTCSVALAWLSPNTSLPRIQGISPHTTGAACSSVIILRHNLPHR